MTSTILSPFQNGTFSTEGSRLFRASWSCQSIGKEGIAHPGEPGRWVVHLLFRYSFISGIKQQPLVANALSGYDQGVMGGVNTNRNYAHTMKFGHFNQATDQVHVDKPLQQGGIVRLASHPIIESNTESLTDRCLLPARDLGRSSLGRMAWR